MGNAAPFALLLLQPLPGDTLGTLLLCLTDGSPRKDDSIAREPSHVTVMRVLVTPPPLPHGLLEDGRSIYEDETNN